MNVKNLISRDPLIVAGCRDQEATLEAHILPIFRVLEGSSAKKLSIEKIDSDHSFENSRGRLAQWVIDRIIG
jgi:hypothetical protein